MDIPDSGDASVELVSTHKDRSAGLVIFGILTILLGCLVGLMVPLILLGQHAAAQKQGFTQPLSMMLPVVCMYGLLAVALIWLGIGSIMARRWARALLLIFSWAWLVMGIWTTACMVVFLPKIMPTTTAAAAQTGGPAVSPAVMTGIMTGVLVVFAVLFVLLPLVWLLFYRSRHVKATCEARDPVPRWTDACPLPVLALSLFIAFSVPMMLVMPFMGHAVMPIFGVFLTGIPASAFFVFIAALWAYASWSLYKLNVGGWWVLLFALCIFSVSGVVTFAHHDLMEMYRLMGYPQPMIDQLQKMNIFTGNFMMWMMLAGMIPFLAYLLFIKRYFRQPA